MDSKKLYTGTFLNSTKKKRKNKTVWLQNVWFKTMLIPILFIDYFIQQNFNYFNSNKTIDACS